MRHRHQRDEGLLGLAGGVHTFVLRAKQSGHFRAVNASVTWTIDKTPPAVPNVQQVPTPTGNSTASVSFTGDSTVNHFVCSVAETSPTAQVVQAEATCTSPYLVPGPLSSGTYVASVSAVDAVGNRSAAGTTTWVVDTTAPGSPVFTAQPANPTHAATAHFVWTSDPDVVATSCFSTAPRQPRAAAPSTSRASRRGHTPSWSPTSTASATTPRHR